MSSTEGLLILVYNFISVSVLVLSHITALSYPCIILQLSPSAV